MSPETALVALIEGQGRALSQQMDSLSFWLESRPELRQTLSDTPFRNAPGTGWNLPESTERLSRALKLLNEEADAKLEAALKKAEAVQS